ncbi:MAG: Fur family transcriptional regulator [Chloroflexota bacterium]
MTHHTKNYTEMMRERGFRVTPQRQLILDVICKCSNHTTPEAIYKRVRVKFPSVNLATVYRSLDFLCEMRLVVATQIGRKMYYEIAGESPHHHLVCRNCNKIEQIDHASMKSLFNKVEREQDFTVDMDHLTLFGLCAKCRRLQS